jgi:hypothetical protein
MALADISSEMYSVLTFQRQRTFRRLSNSSCISHSLNQFHISNYRYEKVKRNHTMKVESFEHLDFIGIDVTVPAELYAGFKD